MKEILYIRISSQENAAIQWLITNSAQQDEIASGTLANRHELSQLTSKAADRTVRVLVSGADVRLNSLNIPGKSERAIRAAAPYMLEDELAHDVEQLFFAYTAKPSRIESQDNCFFALVLQQQVELWLMWFKDADIVVREMLPDILALPLNQNAWSAVQIDEQWLIRESAWQAMVVDDSLLETILSCKLQQDDQQTLDLYSPLGFSPENVNIVEQPAELPMLLLAKGYEQSKFNLLQGPFSIKEQRSPLIRNWLQVAALAFFALLLNMGSKAYELVQLSNQYETLSTQIAKDYRKAFPQTKRVRINTVKKQLSSKIKELGGNTGDSSLLLLVEKLRPAFIKVPTLKPDSLRYDAKRSELRLSVTAKDYQSFEHFKNELEKSSLQVETGALNNQGEQVVGSFTIKGTS